MAPLILIALLISAMTVGIAWRARGTTASMAWPVLIFGLMAVGGVIAVGGWQRLAAQRLHDQCASIVIARDGNRDQWAWLFKELDAAQSGAIIGLRERGRIELNKNLPVLYVEDCPPSP